MAVCRTLQRRGTGDTANIYSGRGEAVNDGGIVVADLADVEVERFWSDTEPEVDFRLGFPVAAVHGAERSVATYWEVDAGQRTGAHTDSEEEVLYVLAGVVELATGNAVRRLAAGQLAVIPRMSRHDVRTVGPLPAQGLSFYAGARVTTTFDAPLMPWGLRCISSDDLA